ncbi:superoxide dismutase [Flavobacterium sp. TSSA_36]|uniref:superoxide dismutase n=1 Tax=Flavobacterium sp. TSSA_36 TaxID=3447669 RepID=UPI003F3D73F8
MKKYFLITPLLSLILLTSCQKKELVEVVEVPLPSAEEKINIGNPEDVKADDGSFQVEPLPYKYDDLSPTFSALALELHFSKHYLTYTNNLNKALKGTALENLTIEEIITKLDINNADLRNNAGGYYNHSLFWKVIAPKAGGIPKDTLAGAIQKNFGSFENFTAKFKNTASKHFGSGWIWLVVDREGNLQITTTQNQDNPLMPNAPVIGYHGKPILGLDVWEHAYYIDYQYKRKNYIDGFFEIINWNKVNENYQATFKKK